MAIDQEDQDKLEISKEKDKQEQLQKIKEDADLWEERRNKLKDKAMEISADPQAWLKGFLMKKAAEAGHYAISKKRRLEVAAEKEKESKIGKKDNSDKLKTAVELKKLEIEPSEIKFGFEAKEITRITESLRDIELNTRKIISVRDAKNIAAKDTVADSIQDNTTAKDTVADSIQDNTTAKDTVADSIQDNTTTVAGTLEKGNSIRLSQFKAENRISASEEAASPSKPQVVTSASKPQVPQVVTSASKPQVPQVVTSDPANNLQRDKDNSGNSPILTENLSLAETLPALVDAIQYNTESIISAMKKGRKRSLIKMIITHAARLMTLNTLIDAIQYNTTAVVEALEKGNSIRLSQFKAENRISASEEAASASSSTPGKSDAGGVKRKSMISGLKGIKDDIFSSGGGGLKGIIGNILSKFGVAGKFLLGLGTTFLLPLITNPVGWAVLAGLAVGGLVFAYWDDIVSFVGKMFDGVKSMFSKVVSKISSMFSAVGDAIKEVISFFNPMNLLPMIAKALLPADMYGAISGFFGSGDTN
jgi:nucleoid DNA-binding protein